MIAIGETQERLCWIVPPSFTPTLLAIYNEDLSLPRVARGACAAVDRQGRRKRPLRRALPRRNGDGRRPGVSHRRRALSSAVRAAARRRADARETARRTRRPPGDASCSARCRRRSRIVTCARGVHLPPLRRRRARMHRHPPGYADAGVLVPIPGSPLGVAVGVGGNPRYGKRRSAARRGARGCSKRLRNVIAVGATPVGLTDCLNFGDPDRPRADGRVRRGGRRVGACRRARSASPFVSGNVSLYNRSSTGAHVAPSPIVGCVGTFADVSVTTGPGVQAPGLACRRSSAPIRPRTCIGGSVVAGLLGGRRLAAPADRLGTWSSARARSLTRVRRERIVALAVHDVTDGGALVGAGRRWRSRRDRLALRIGSISTTFDVAPDR